LRGLLSSGVFQQNEQSFTDARTMNAGRALLKLKRIEAAFHCSRKKEAP